MLMYAHEIRVFCYKIVVHMGFGRYTYVIYNVMKLKNIVIISTVRWLFINVWNGNHVITIFVIHPVNETNRGNML